MDLKVQWNSHALPAQLPRLAKAERSDKDRHVLYRASLSRARHEQVQQLTFTEPGEKDQKRKITPTTAI